MPLYEYECEVCGKIKEAIQKFSDTPLEKCGHCSGKMHKLISNSTFHLKGGGWYVTDYGNNATTTNSPKATDSSSETGSNDSKSSSKGTD